MFSICLDMTTLQPSQIMGPQFVFGIIEKPLMRWCEPLSFCTF
jgi:hypothetical protein